MEEKTYVVPPRGDGHEGESKAAGPVETTSASAFQAEVNAKLDAILAMLGGGK